ncbi:hypothetical protein [Ideonella oryzae]|uniref:Uncharacterized protein n=1 Tax=Ideonella oryzae TaxID=2937441 RepID=A0ABT1BSV3_9BURK|nr:hypothetical protein [Ideonella oryzae]MCO5978994.1 hypothetical protein [Ideonella oryzae]
MRRVINGLDVSGVPAKSGPARLADVVMLLRTPMLRPVAALFHAIARR